MIRYLPIVVGILWLAGFPKVSAQPFTGLDSIRGSYHANRSCYDLTHYHLRVAVNPQTRYLSGKNRLSALALSPSRTLQIDLAENFDISSITTSLGPARWKRLGTAVQLTLPAALSPGQSFWVEVEYGGHPHAANNPPWEGGFVWQKDTEGQPWVAVCCEGEGASLWFPCKDHPADEPDSVRMEYDVPRHLTAVGNGRLLSKKTITDSTTRFTYRVSYPINHYNITLCAGVYQTWKDTVALPGGQCVDMQFFALPADFQKAKKQFAQAKPVLRSMATLFGPYPFERDGYQLVQVPFLGMEHQSCIAYGDQFTDNAFGFDYIVMHETGHEWWGNRTSAADHADMWIHESFCTYAEALFVEKREGRERAHQYLIGQKKKIKNKTPIQGPVNVYFNNWEDSDMYYKGSWMLHSLRYVVNNDSLWFAWLRSFGETFGLKPIASADVIANAELFLGKRLKSFFRQYLQQTEWPVLQYRTEQQDGNTQLHYRWKTNDEHFVYPAPVVVDGKTIRLEASSTWQSTMVGSKNAGVEPGSSLFLFRLEATK